MPTYDYVCDACGHALELFQSMSEAPKRKCPACNALKLRRLVGTGAGVLFKGSGFYQTDYRSDSYKQGESASKSSAEAAKPADASAATTPSAKDGSSKDVAKPADAKKSGTSKSPKKTD